MKAQTPTAAAAETARRRGARIDTPESPRTLQHRTRAATRGPRQVPRRTVQPRPGATARLAWKAPSRTLQLRDRGAAGHARQAPPRKLRRRPRRLRLIRRDLRSARARAPGDQARSGSWSSKTAATPASPWQAARPRSSLRSVGVLRPPSAANASSTTSASACVRAGTKGVSACHMPTAACGGDRSSSTMARQIERAPPTLAAAVTQRSRGALRRALSISAGVTAASTGRQSAPQDVREHGRVAVLGVADGNTSLTQPERARRRNSVPLGGEDNPCGAPSCMALRLYRV